MTTTDIINDQARDLLHRLNALTADIQSNWADHTGAAYAAWLTGVAQEMQTDAPKLAEMRQRLAYIAMRCQQLADEGECKVKVYTR